MVALEQKSAWKGWQVDTEQQSNLLWKLSKTPYGANNSSAQIFKEKPESCLPGVKQQHAMQFSPAAMYGNQRNSRATNQFYRKEILKNEK